MQLKAFTDLPTPVRTPLAPPRGLSNSVSNTPAFITPARLSTSNRAPNIHTLNQRTRQSVTSLRAAPEHKNEQNWLQSLIQKKTASEVAELEQHTIEPHTVNTAESDALVNTPAQEPSTEALSSLDPKDPEFQKQLLDIGTAITAAATILASQPALAADPNTVNDFMNWKDALISAGAGAGAAGWVNLWSNLAEQGVVDSKTTRKLIHITSAPLFMATWPLFSEAPAARFVAAAVPLLQLGRLIAASQDDDSKMASAISRTNKGSELLKGPAIYAGILALASLAWRNNPGAITAITQMAVGDGMADIAGRNFAPKDGTGRIPWNKDKSIAGTVGYIASASAATWGMLNWFASQGMLQPDTPVLPAAIGLSVVCGLIETLPAEKIKIDDNISVPLAAAVLGQMIFGGKV